MNQPLQASMPVPASHRARNFGSRRRRAFTLGGLALLVGGLPGCQNVTSTQPIAEVRIIDASPDAGGIDVYQGSGVLAYNLGLGTITSYIPLSPGTYTISVNRASTAQQLVSARGTFPAGQQRTVLVGNYLTSLQEQILVDQATPAPSGQVALRFIDQSTRASSVDLYLVPSGSTIASVRPVQTGVAFSANTGYLNVPAGTYTLVAVPSGTVPTSTTASLYTGTAISYASGSAHTIVLTDQQLATTSSLQAIVADDYNPPGA